MATIMKEMEELSEVKAMAIEWMYTQGFAPPSLFLVGTKSRMGYTFTALPSDFSEETQDMVRLDGEVVAKDHQEVGRLVRAYLVTDLRVKADDQLQKEVLLIHGVNIADNEQHVIAFEVFRKDEHLSLTQREVPYPIPEHRILKSFVKGFNTYMTNMTN